MDSKSITRYLFSGSYSDDFKSKTKIRVINLKAFDFTITDDLRQTSWRGLGEDVRGMHFVVLQKRPLDGHCSYLSDLLIKEMVSL